MLVDDNLENDMCDPLQAGNLREPVEVHIFRDRNLKDFQFGDR
jgi:hypothetical protein